MNNNSAKSTLSIKGEIIEVFEKEGNRFAKIKCQTSYIIIPMNQICDSHLGDTVEVDSELIIKNIKQNNLITDRNSKENLSTSK